MSGSTVADWIGAGANLITAVAVAGGVFIANRQLGSWRPEAQEKRKAEVAEELISAANDADAALRFIRSPWGNTPPKEDEDPSSFQWRERIERMDQRRGDFDRLRHAQIRSKAFIGDEEVNKAVDQIFDVRQEVWAALATLATGTETDGDRELRDFYIDLRWKAYGTYSDRDLLGIQQQTAIKTLEERLYPFVRLEPTRKKK